MALSAEPKLSVLWATDGSANARNAQALLRQLVLPAAERFAVVTVVPHFFISGARPDPAFLTPAPPAPPRAPPPGPGGRRRAPRRPPRRGRPPPRLALPRAAGPARGS